MRLSDYLDRFSWTQAELSRQAGVSPQCVARALAGKTITRRNAEAIISALNHKHKMLGSKGSITIASIKGLHITELHRKRQPAAEQEAEGEEPGNDQSDQ